MSELVSLHRSRWSTRSTGTRSDHQMGLQQTSDRLLCGGLELLRTATEGDRPAFQMMQRKLVEVMPLQGPAGLDFAVAGGRLHSDDLLRIATHDDSRASRGENILTAAT